MPPLPTFDTQDSIPSPFRDAYEEREGKWVPKADGNADGVAAQNRRLLDEKKKLDEQLKGLLGNRTPDEVTEILSTHAKSEEERAKKAGEFDKLMQKRLDQQLSDLKPKLEEGEKAIAALSKRVFADKVREYGEPAGLNPKMMKAILRTVEDDYLTLDGEDLVVVGPDGSKRSITPEDFFTKEFKKDYPEFYLGNGGSGGGSSNSGSDRRSSSNANGSIAATDTKGFLDNLGDIASGKKKVVVG